MGLSRIHLIRATAAAIASCAAATVAFVFYAWQPALPAVATPRPQSFAPEMVARGAQLAALGNCASCHTAEGRPLLSGGRAFETSFGTLFSTNLTPDPQTGLGTWSEAAFIRAMRQGLDRNGRHLYPAFPYDHFTRVSDDDDRALYAFLMTREPVRASPPANSLVFPFNIRMLVAGWKLMFFHPGALAPEPSRDPAWKRGRYLVEGLGHCGACHTPHNAFGAEIVSEPLAGGTVDGWSAYALNAASPAPVPWTVDAMTAYLGHGWAAHHGVSQGPMADVTRALADVPAEDLSAIGTFLVSGMGIPSPSRVARARSLDDADADAAITPAGMAADHRPSPPSLPAGTNPHSGAAIFASACASCHDGAQAVPGGGLPLDLSTATHAPDPSNIIAVTRRGLAPGPGDPGGVMPDFAGALDHRDLVALLAYLRQHVAQEPPWPRLDEAVRAAATGGPNRPTPVPAGTTTRAGS